MLKTLIIQASHPRTGSTLIANAIQGLIHPQNHLVCMDRADFTRLDKLFESGNVALIKTHNIYTKYWKSKLSEYCSVYIVSTRREGVQEFKGADMFLYYELFEKYEYPELVKKIASNLFQDGIDLRANTVKAVERLRAMDEITEQMKNLPFTEVDPKFGIHGSHRNRA